MKAPDNIHRLLDGAQTDAWKLEREPRDVAFVGGSIAVVDLGGATLYALDGTVRFRAEGTSMYPTIRDGETITVAAASILNVSTAPAQPNPPGIKLDHYACYRLSAAKPFRRQRV